MKSRQSGFWQMRQIAKQFQNFIIFMYSQHDIYLNTGIFTRHFEPFYHTQALPQQFFYLYPSNSQPQKSFMLPTYFSELNERPENTLKEEEEPSESQIEEHPSENIGVAVEKIFLTKKQLESVPETKQKITWTEKEDEMLCRLIEEQNLSWKDVAVAMDRTYKMCYSRYRRIRLGIKNCWRKDEEQKARELVEKLGKKWKQISKHLPGRAPKQIRERYINFIRPNIKNESWSVQQDIQLIDLINLHGKKWKKISEVLEKRTQNQIKNRFFSRILRIWNNKQKNNN